MLINEYRSLPLRIVDGLELAERYREVLRPTAMVADRQGRMRRLPRFFYEIDSRKTARETMLAAHFALSEFIEVDVREAAALRVFPRYVPCAVTLLAAQLELFRLQVGATVRIAANGAYRSPAHALSTHASTHAWGTAVNIYQIGDELLNEQESIERFAGIAMKLLPGIWSRPYGHNLGYADDHLHLDLGFVTVTPRDAASETGE
ncbi:MAG TPA: hypothetical protein VF747_05625 [Blastocatellia bacterium]|jgi:hypothetical protein